MLPLSAILTALLESSIQTLFLVHLPIHAVNDKVALVASMLPFRERHMFSLLSSGYYAITRG